MSKQHKFQLEDQRPEYKGSARTYNPKEWKTVSYWRCVDCGLRAEMVDDSSNPNTKLIYSLDDCNERIIKEILNS